MQHSTLRIAWRNLGRNKKRTLLAVGAIALGQLTLVFITGLMAGAQHDMLQTATGPLVGHVQVHHRDWREERAVDLYIDDIEAVKSTLQSLPQVKTVSTRIFAPVLSAFGEKTDTPADAEPAVIVGIDVAAESEKGGLLELVAPEERPDEQGVLIGVVLANRLHLKPGQQVALIGQDADGFPVSDLFRVKGLLNSSVDIVNTLGVVMLQSTAGLFLGMPNQAHEIIIQGDDYLNADALAKAVAALPEFASLEVLSWKEAMPELIRFIELKKWFDFILLAIVFAAAAAGIANTSLMSTYERTHELGMLLSLGARPRRLIRMVLIESILLGIAGVVIGAFFGALLILITAKTGVNFVALGGSDAEGIAYAGINISYVYYPQLEWQQPLYGLIAVVLTSILAATWPAAHISKLEPVEALRS